MNERNELIARLYSKEKRNGPQLAARFGMTEGRIYQIVRIYSEKEMPKYTARIPTVMIEPEKKEKIEKIANELGVSISVMVRWGIDAMIEKYSGTPKEPKSKIDPDLG